MEKNYENHPFRVGDTVYHPLYGKGEVKEIDAIMKPIRVVFGGNSVWLEVNIPMLSFTHYELNSNWERPFEPKDGDVVYREYEPTSGIEIHKEYINDRIYCHAFLSQNGFVETLLGWSLKSDLIKERAATEEEKKQLFDAIAEEGKRWNAERKCIEDDDTPKIGDKCIFWDDDCDFVRVDILGAINEGKSYPYWTAKEVCYEQCIKYSDEKLIEMMNKGL